MLDLQQAWKKLEAQGLQSTSPITRLNPNRSKHPVERLKRAYWISAGFSITFLLIFIGLFFWFHEAIIRLGLATVIATYIFFTVVNVRMYKLVNMPLAFDQSVKDMLVHTHNFITKNIRFQEQVALVLYPFCAAAGMLMGLTVGGETATALVQKTSVQISLLIVPLILTPLAWWLARWMYQQSYGKCLHDLHVLIQEMEQEEA
jgi:hypothetical protein